MEATIDNLGRILVPKALRDRLGLVPGMTVDVSQYGDGLHIVPAGRAAALQRRDNKLVATSNTEIDDNDVFGLIDSIRRRADHGF